MKSTVNRKRQIVELTETVGFFIIIFLVNVWQQGAKTCNTRTRAHTERVHRRCRKVHEEGKEEMTTMAEVIARKHNNAPNLCRVFAPDMKKHL